jgi:FlaA1/EpsC-like NDP-sugar epimerase
VAGCGRRGADRQRPGCCPGTSASKATPARATDRYLDWDVVVLVVGIMLPVFIAFGFYNRWWRYVSTQDMWGCSAASSAP